MPFADLSHVTLALKALIERKYFVTFAEDIFVTAAPPDADDAADKISVHLFHIQETAHTKNVPPQRGTGDVPVRLTPMGLTLQYVITAVHTAADEVHLNVLMEQRLIGFVAKTIHDFPIIKNTTVVSGPSGTEMPLGILGENVVQLIVRPVGIDETINFWSSEQERTTRLSLYVEARVILLQEEEPDRIPGIVLAVNDFIFTSTGPELTGSRNTLTFTPPGAPGLTTLLASPARVALFDDPPVAGSPPAANNRLVLEGSGLFAPGTRRLLTLRRGITTVVRLNLDVPSPLPPNDAWAVDATAATISVSIHRSVEDVAGGVVSILPGVHGARLVMEDALTPGKVLRGSNEIAFAIVPQVIDLDDTSAPVYTLTLSGAYLGEVDPDDITLAVAGDIFTRTTSAPAAGQFRLNASNDSIDFQRFVPAPDPLTADNPLPVILRINGVTATPVWITTP